MSEEQEEPRKLPDTIGNSLGLTPVDAVLAPVDLSKDLSTGVAYKDADKTLDNVIQAGTFSLQDLADKASQATGRDAMSFHRVMSEVTNSLSNAAKAKMEIRALEAKIRLASTQLDKPEGTVTNNTLVLTTKDLADLIKGEKTIDHDHDPVT